MDKRTISSGLGILAAAAILASCGAPVAIKTGGLSTKPGFVACLTSGTTGDLVTDEGAGTAILEQQTGRRVPVVWPVGWTARSTWSGVEVLDTRGNVRARTGTWVSLMGGYWEGGTFLTCGPVPE